MTNAKSSKGLRKTATTVRLIFRQGSFSRELPCESVDHAFARVGEFLYRDGCSDFRIVDGQDRTVHDDGSIRRIYTQLSKGDEHTDAG